MFSEFSAVQLDRDTAGSDLMAFLKDKKTSTSVLLSPTPSSIDDVNCSASSTGVRSEQIQDEENLHSSVYTDDHINHLLNDQSVASLST